MKSLKVLVTIVCVALIIAGCVMRDYPPVYDLPEDANSYELIYNEDTGATLIGNDAVFMKDTFGL
jgi:hypothetical protein